MDKAVEALENAEYDLNGGFTLATANRAYYACYYCMTALLYTKDVYAKSHYTPNKNYQHGMRT